MSTHKSRNNGFARADFHKNAMAQADFSRLVRRLEAQENQRCPDTRLLYFDRDGCRIPESTR
jgi:hypothetical protein